MSIIERAVRRLEEKGHLGQGPEERPGGASAGGPAGEEALGDAPDAAARPEAPEGEGRPAEAPQAPDGSIVIDLERIRAHGFPVVVPGDKSRLAEEFRHLKRPLLMNAFGEGALPATNRNLVMVTSARPGEGKTFTSFNLALSIAQERDKTVMLVDADVPRPSVARLLGIQRVRGLVDHLDGALQDFGACILRTSIPNLRVVSAGRRHPHATELLGSQAMKALCHELATRYPDRMVIFDSPPLLPTTEAGVLAGLVGQVVIVVEAERTRRDELREARERIPAGRYVGLVLNKARRPFGVDRYYDAYDAYGYGSGD